MTWLIWTIIIVGVIASILAALQLLWIAWDNYVTDLAIEHGPYYIRVLNAPPKYSSTYLVLVFTTKPDDDLTYPEAMRTTYLSHFADSQFGAKYWANRLILRDINRKAEPDIAHRRDIE